MKKGFTLIELLIVVLIIGILAAIALPQYRKAVERTKLSEAVTIVKQIALANQRYYLATGAYLTLYDMDKLDIEIKGELSDNNMIQTKDFMYAIGWTTINSPIAYAQRVPAYEKYYLRIFAARPNQVNCIAYENATAIEREVCNELNARGTL